MVKKISINLGDVYGSLKITKDLGLVPYGSQGKKHRLVEAKCLNCSSEEKSYILSNIKRLHTTSCGCVRKETLTKHSLSTARQYRIWAYILQRCNNVKHGKWDYYGGRGISVCEKWLSFEGFWQDMWEGYSDNLELDRINVDGNYCKENCRWTTRGENCYNRRIQNNNTSGKSGVVFNKKAEKWQVSIGVKGTQKYLGLFDSYEEAVAVREKAEIEIYGYTKE